MMYFVLAVCVYKGKEYNEGQRWRDGCDYNCECVDGMTGLYDCTEMWVNKLQSPFFKLTLFNTINDRRTVRLLYI